MTIKDYLDSLTDAQRQKLMFAFEHDLCQYVEIPNKKFVGVNCRQNPNLQIEQEAGQWSTGEIKGQYQ